MDMDMGNSSSASHACKISMLWNWTTVDACFISKTWHVRSKGAFAGSVIGVFFLVLAIEGLRRIGREYDRQITRHALQRASSNGSFPDNTITAPFSSGLIRKKTDPISTLPVLGSCSAPACVPSWSQQLLRSAIYGTQFTASFLIMLLGMYYNGYILFAIFIGHTVGYGLFGRDTVTVYAEGTGSGHCC